MTSDVCVSVPINRVAQAGAGSGSVGQRVARIGAPSTLPAHHLPQQVGRPLGHSVRLGAEGDREDRG